MKNVKFLFVSAALCAVSACGEPAQEETSAPAAEAPAATPVSQGVAATQLSALAEKGKRVYLRCRSCHTIEKGGPHLTGPNLHGIVGDKAAAREGYVYSEALKSSGLVWDEATLDSWYQSPSELVTGTKMAFAGLPNQEDRDALTAYMKEASAPPADQ